MAEIIQGQLTIIHKVEQTQPTEPQNPTTPNSDDTTFDAGGLDGIKPDDVGTKGAKKVMGKTSIRRRLSNMALVGVERVINRSFDDAMFRESLTGDRTWYEENTK